jgi:succinoglycan biosynthesis protein ExoA
MISRKVKANTNNLPFVSVLMPVRNEGAYIERSLGAVLTQSYPHDRLEVVVADGVSSDNTRDLIEKLGANTDIKLVVLDNHKQVTPVGLNLAIEQSIGDILILIGGHTEIEPDYVRNCVRHLEENKAEVVGGPIETIGETLQARSIAASLGSTFGVGGNAFRTVSDRELFVDTVAFGAYKRKVLDRLGMFDEELVRNQDDEYNYRIREHGGKILLTPDIRSRYYSRSTLLTLWRQYLKYGFYKVRVLQLHPLQMQMRQFVPLIFVVLLLFSFAVAIFSMVGLVVFAAFLGIYLFANLIASAKIAAKEEIGFLPLLPIVFFILHFSYGLGFLSGLAYFANRWGEVPKYKFSPTNMS